MERKTLIKRILAVLAMSAGLAVLPAAQALAAPSAPAATAAAASQATALPELAAPAGLRAAVAPHRAVLRWNAVRGASDYELRITGPSRFDRVVPDGLRHAGVTVVLAPGRYSAAVRAGRSVHDVHGHWSAALGFTVPGSHPVTTGSSLAARALAWAFAQAGKPYVWGGSGPGGFDCSGLVMAAYLHADGISLPHNTVAMLGSGKLARTYSPQPGDAAFYGTGHVELYVRSGVTWGAHHSGTVIGFTYYAGSSWRPTAFYRVV
jgi:cell wall-associated NlpC family hydrolase